MTSETGDPRPTPGQTAEGEEQDVFERSLAERGPLRAAPEGDGDDPREEDGWSQPESSAQKGAVRDEG
jgi:hypothetical protein